MSSLNLTRLGMTYPDSFRKLMCWCIVSRIFVVVLIVLSNIALPDHDAEGVHIFEFEDNEVVSNMWRSFTKWDAAYFLQIARHGYQFESSFAFFPLYPLCIHLLGQYIANVTSISPDICAIIAGVCISNCCFVLTVYVLWHLLTEIKISLNIRLQAVWLFCCNPANIFFSSVYSESCYACLAFSGMLLWEKNFPFVSLLLFVFASGTRSNGMLNAVFLFSHALSRQFMPSPRVIQRTICNNSNGLWSQWRQYVYSFGQGLYIGCCCCVCTLSYFIYSFFVHYHLCENTKLTPTMSPIASYTDKMSELITYFTEQLHYLTGADLLSVDNTLRESNILFNCDEKHFLSIYSSIQFNYWNVGFLRYYSFKQLPNFMLATPIYLLCFLICKYYWMKFLSFQAKVSTNKLRNKYPTIELFIRNMQLFVYVHGKMIPYIIHMVAVGVVALCFAHIQISTRLIFSSCPVICCQVCFLWNEQEGVQEEVEEVQIALNNEDEGGERNNVRRRFEGANSSKNMRVVQVPLPPMQISQARHKHAHTYMQTKFTAETEVSKRVVAWRRKKRIKQMVMVYFIAYNVAGVLLHPNFFPWT